MARGFDIPREQREAGEEAEQDRLERRARKLSREFSGDEDSWGTFWDEAERQDRNQ